MATPDPAGSDRTGGHYYCDEKLVEVAEVERAAVAAYHRTGRRQWVHRHPHGHLCNHRCEIVPAPPVDVGGALTL